MSSLFLYAGAVHAPTEPVGSSLFIYSLIKPTVDSGSSLHMYGNVINSPKQPKGSSLFSYANVLSSSTRLIPKMTSATTPTPFVITSSGSASAGTEAFYAFTRVYGEYFSAPAGVSAFWVAVDMGAITDVDFYKIEEDRLPARNPRDWTIQGSNDNSTWDVIDTQVGISWVAGEVKDFKLASRASYRYYKIDVTDNNGDASYAVLGQFDLYQAAAAEPEPARKLIMTNFF